MNETLLSTGVPDPLEERLTQALPRLEAYLHRRTRRTPQLDARDLAQEVVARALRYRTSFDPGRALWPWLHRLADRVVLDQHSRHLREPQASPHLDPPAPERASEFELREEIRVLLAGLQDDERQALVRFHQSGQSVSEIAAAMRIPEGTVKSHLSRARRRLAQAPRTGESR